MSKDRKIKISFEVSEAEALALAQFVKRVGFSDWRANSSDDDEAYLMKDAFNCLHNGLSKSGFAPR